MLSKNGSHSGSRTLLAVDMSNQKIEQFLAKQLHSARKLTLTLLMLRILADDHNSALPLNNLALFAHWLDGWSYFHILTLLPFILLTHSSAHVLAEYLFSPFFVKEKIRIFSREKREFYSISVRFFVFLLSLRAKQTLPCLFTSPGNAATGQIIRC